MGVVFFSGHGTRDPEGNFYLVPVDVDERDRRRTCIAGASGKTALRNVPGRLIAILGACHSGATTEGQRGAPGWTTW